MWRAKTFHLDQIESEMQSSDYAICPVLLIACPPCAAKTLFSAARAATTHAWCQLLQWLSTVSCCFYALAMPSRSPLH